MRSVVLPVVVVSSSLATDLEAVVLLPFLVPNLVAEVDLQH